VCNLGAKLFCSWYVLDTFQIRVRVAAIGLKNKQLQATIFASLSRPPLSSESSLTARSLYSLQATTSYSLHPSLSLLLSPSFAKLCAESNRRLYGSFAVYRLPRDSQVWEPDRSSPWLCFAPTTTQCNPSEAPIASSPLLARKWRRHMGHAHNCGGSPVGQRAHRCSP